MFPLEPSSAEIRARVGLVLDALLPWLDRVGERAIARSAGAKKRAAAFDAPWADDGVPLPTILRKLAPGLEASLQTGSPGYLGYVPGGGLPDAAIAELYVLLTNRYTTLAVGAPEWVALEMAVIRWFADAVGFGPEAGGVLLSGGSMANLVGVVTARSERQPPPGRGRILVTEQAHHSIRKAAFVAGFTPEQVVVVPGVRLEPEALRAAIAAERAGGNVPFLVVANAGSTALGVVDPLDAVADVIAEAGAWLHVDAAYGGFFRLTDRGRSALSGLERADSVCLDPHKGLFFPYGTGAVVVRDRGALRRAHAVSSAYLPETDGDGLWDFADLSPELSREARGLRAWWTLVANGRRAFVEALDEKLDLARDAAARIARLPGVILVSEPTLSLFAFRHASDDATNRRWLSKTNARDRVFLTGATVPIDGVPTFVLRVCVLCFRTHAERIDALVADLGAALAEVTDPR
jgi:aromatic-L-amino-acid/L-tryptophan decarboxylase